MIKDVDLAYIAAFLDTDGCITVSYGRETKSGYRIPVPMIAFYNRDLKTLEWIQSIFGGKIYDKPRATKEHNIARQLFLRNQFSEIFDCIKLIRPFLRIKKDQADCLVAYLESRRNRGWKPNAHLPPIKNEIELAEKIRWLNQNRYFKNDVS